jgi:hypothetical protein
MSRLDYNQLSWSDLVAQAADALNIVNVPAEKRGALAKAASEFKGVPYEYSVQRVGYILFKTYEKKVVDAKTQTVDSQKVSAADKESDSNLD